MEQITANGQGISVERAGAGPPVLLIHGAEGDLTMFDALAARLTDRFTVIRYDQRDCGQTRNDSNAYSLADLADDAAALIAALGYGRAHVFGHSLGGVIAQNQALRHPEGVHGLVLSSTFHAGTSPIPLNPTVFAHIAKLRQDLPKSAPDIAEYFFPEAFLAEHPGLAAMFDGSRRTPEQAARRARLGVGDAAADLASIRAPTLVLAGSEDRLIPPRATQALASEIPGAGFEWVEGAGHIGPLQKPETVAAALDRFLHALRGH